jgi:hypothetical protein
MVIDGITYEFTRASDVIRDGFSLWCERLDAGGERHQVMEAFWHDPTGRFTISAFEDSLPYELVQAFLKAAAHACPPVGSNEVGTRVLIYVKLLDEGVDVWRPVTAALVGPERTYEVLGEEPLDERWEFGPGTVVVCGEHRFDDGTRGMVALRVSSREHR